MELKLGFSIQIVKHHSGDQAGADTRFYGRFDEGAAYFLPAELNLHGQIASQKHAGKKSN
jgi:hypothetical protein